jgi:hypothetical protein
MSIYFLFLIEVLTVVRSALVPSIAMISQPIKSASLKEKKRV